MLEDVIESTIEEELSKEKQIIYEKLANIFDPETAISYVCPKTNEPRDDTTLEDLRLQSEDLKQKPSRIIIYKKAKAAYQSFVRDQVAQQTSRHELERFVRTSSDIDSAKRYLDMANEVLINPHQSQLLFRSSKLNEQKANLLKSSGYCNRLQQLNEDPSIQKYFSETLNNTSRDSIQDQDEEEDFFAEKQNLSRSRSIHLQHNEKKYHVQFLKDCDAHDPVYRTTNRRCLPLTQRLTQINIESLFGAENSLSQGQSAESNVQRDTFPPLTVAALKEYCPSFSAKSTSQQRKASEMNTSRQRKSMRKADFIWNQSVVASKKSK
ncbi:hypothetical protein I4U23_019129 [Adineta vaga]|nr:hypothetical protein I4U23_019129 [Adineta vaga]